MTSNTAARAVTNTDDRPLTVHPAAEAYRFMTEEELSSLAADIAENGQTDLIILGRVNGSTEQHQIVDGRNRAKACGIAGVVPRFETREFEDDDAIRAFVKSRSERRDISKGQRAMGYALLFPDAKQGGSRKKGASSETELGFSKVRLSEARAVLAYSRDLALAVRDGTESLDDAYATVRAERSKLDTKEAKIARLRKDAPDLAELVDDERMSLGDAIAALDDRERKATEEKKNQREVVMRLSEGFYRGALAWSVGEFAERVAEDLYTDADFRKQFFERLQIKPDLLDECRAGAINFVKQLRPLLEGETK